MDIYLRSLITPITLIHKKKNPTKVNISEVFVMFPTNLFYNYWLNRLSVVLPKIIYPLPIAFIPHRDTNDNILIACEILATFDKTRFFFYGN